MSIIDLIDSAVRDYGASPDAMHWMPEPPKVQPGPGFVISRLTIDGVDVSQAAHRAGLDLHSSDDAFQRQLRQLRKELRCVLARTRQHRRAIRPLCIDGAAYRRRAKRRQGRG